MLWPISFSYLIFWSSVICPVVSQWTPNGQSNFQDLFTYLQRLSKDMSLSRDPQVFATQMQSYINNFQPSQVEYVAQNAPVAVREMIEKLYNKVTQYGTSAITDSLVVTAILEDEFDVKAPHDIETLLRIVRNRYRQGLTAEPSQFQRLLEDIPQSCLRSHAVQLKKRSDGFSKPFSSGQVGAPEILIIIGMILVVLSFMLHFYVALSIILLPFYPGTCRRSTYAVASVTCTGIILGGVMSYIGPNKAAIAILATATIINLAITTGEYVLALRFFNRQDRQLVEDARAASGDVESQLSRQIQGQGMQQTPYNQDPTQSTPGQEGSSDIIQPLPAEGPVRQSRHT